MSTWIRATTTATAALAMLAITACEPPPTPDVSTSSGAHGSVIEVTAQEACGSDWFPTVEASLVVSTEAGATVAARALGYPSVRLIVPGWAPLGPATVTTRCLDPLMSHNTSPSYTVTRHLKTVHYEILPGGTGPTGTVNIGSGDMSASVPVSGTACFGDRVSLAAVPIHPVALTSEAFMLYSTASAHPAADGSWAGGASTFYSVDEVWDPPRPGPLTIGASCHTADGTWNYPPATATIGAPTPLPSIHQLGSDDHRLMVTQCLGNEITMTRRVVRAGGTELEETQSVPGGFGPTTVWFTPTPDAVSVSAEASCDGSFDASFSYQPLVLPAEE